MENNGINVAELVIYSFFAYRSILRVFWFLTLISISIIQAQQFRSLYSSYPCTWWTFSFII